jgi:hypothetical protein
MAGRGDRLAETSWRKSSYSGGNAGSNCVEAAVRSDLVGLRDSKNPAGPVLAFPEPGWRRFVGALRYL